LLAFLGTTKEKLERTATNRIESNRIVVTSSAGSVARYCDEYVCLSMCLSVREDISGTTRAIFTTFMLVARVRDSVLLGHIDDRPHRLSAGRG